MCRWIAYKGTPTLLETWIAAPRHSLIDQSLHAEEAKSAINGDGFGIGWYGERPEPGLFREVRPAWSDENLRSLCAQVRSRLFFAHVRASTGSPVSRANCHPFSLGRHMFMHNGQVGNYIRIKRQIEALIPDDRYGQRVGATDSEAIFLSAFGCGLQRDPVDAFAEVLRRISLMMEEAETSEPLRFTAALTDGDDLYAFRWASDDHAPSLYYRQTSEALIIVSEPLDHERTCWIEVPKGCVLVSRGSDKVTIRAIDEELMAAA